MVATWSDSDESNEDSSDDKVANLCLMAHEDNEVSSSSPLQECSGFSNQV